MSKSFYFKQNSRGRGGFSSRGGSYRGSRGDGGSSWGGRGRISSNFSSGGRGGRFSGGSSWDKEVGMDSPRSRYSGGDYGGGNDRYSSRGGDDGSYGRRYSRQGMSPDYGSREHNHRNSPERKRMRSDSSSYQGSSSLRRTHDDSSYSGGNDYNRSYGSFGSSSEDKGGPGGYGDRSRVYREDRDHSRNDDYQYKKLMGPPSGPPRRSSSRGTYRGRSFGGRRTWLPVTSYSNRGMFSRDGYKSRLSMKRMMLDSSYSIRKKEYLQRLKLYKMKRLADRLRSVKTGTKDKDEKKGDKVNGDEIDDDMDDDDDDDDNDDSDDEEEIEVEEEVEEEEDEDEENKEIEEDEEEDGEVDDKETAQIGTKKKKDEELEEGETNEDGEVATSKTKPKKKVVRKIVKKLVKKKIKKEKTGIKRKESDKENDESKEGNLQVTIKQDSESRAVNEEARLNFLGRPYIHLDCRHCNTRCTTFKDYTKHLLTTKHLLSMRKLALKLRQQLARMRIDQRREQLMLDAKHKDNPKLRTFFCSTCKLNHRSLKGEHIASMRHKKMREFLMPYCRVCHLTFRSPMAYENHLCELDHVKRAAKLEYLIAKRKTEKEDAGRNVDMDNFMILDSVGSPDESEEEKEEGDKETPEGENAEKVEKKKKKKSEIKLGLEYCKKIEVMYCDLCNIYLPRDQPFDKVVAQHCRMRVHLERLVRANKYKRRSHHSHLKSKDAKDTNDVKEMVKNIKKEPGEVDKSGCSEVDTSTGSTSNKKKGEASSEHEEGDLDEKLWSEMDKDLGELLSVVEPETKSSDEDEEQGRYDRFKLSEKDKIAEDDKTRSKLSESEKKSAAKDEEDDEEEDEEDEDDDGKEGKSET